MTETNNNKYENGKIYKIVCETTGLVYVGSTIQLLKERLNDHKKKREYVCSSSLVLANNNYKIILIEHYPCDSRKELEIRERYYIELMACVNIYIPGRTRKEKKEKHSKYMKEYKKEYRKKYKREKMTCECGSTFRKDDKVVHYKTKKHKNFISKNSDI